MHLLNSLPLQISKSSIGPKSNCALEKRQRHPIYLIQIEQNQYISTGVREFRFTKSKEKPYHSEIVIHNWIPLDFGIIIIGHLLLNFNSSKRKEQFFFLSLKFSTFDILLAFIKLNYNWFTSHWFYFTSTSRLWPTNNNLIIFCKRNISIRKAQNITTDEILDLKGFV